MSGVAVDRPSVSQSHHQILFVGEPGPLSELLQSTLRTAGHGVETANPAANDLWERAVGCDTIVYVPAPSLLDGALAPKASATRMASILSAANAPGVQLVVAVHVPHGYEAEDELIERDGKPYFVIRSYPTQEELISRDIPAKSCFVARRTVALARPADLAERVLEALDDERVGRVLDVPAGVATLAAVARAGGARTVVQLPEPLLELRRLELVRERLWGDELASCGRLSGGPGTSTPGGGSAWTRRNRSGALVAALLLLPLLVGFGPELWVAAALCLTLMWPLGLAALLLRALLLAARRIAGSDDWRSGSDQGWPPAATAIPLGRGGVCAPAG